MWSGPTRRIRSYFEDNYPDEDKRVLESIRPVNRSFDDIQLLSKLFGYSGYETRLVFMGAIVLMYTESELFKTHYLKRGTASQTARVTGMKDSNTTNDLAAARANMKYRPEIKATSLAMIQILDNYKAQINND